MGYPYPLKPISWESGLILSTHIWFLGSTAPAHMPLQASAQQVLSAQLTLCIFHFLALISQGQRCPDISPTHGSPGRHGGHSSDVTPALQGGASQMLGCICFIIKVSVD